MENEIELKMMVSPAKVAGVVEWLNQQAYLEHRTDVLGNTYYDTPEQFFAQQQMGLRVRSHNHQHEITLKTKGDIVGGLHIRPEYNLPLPSNQPDLNALIQHFNLDLPSTLAAQLVAIFSTDFTRQKWLLAFNQSQIEVALDQGMIKNCYGEEAICEVELELKQGELADVLVLIRQMPLQDGMWFSSLSKAQRGYLVGQAVKFEQEIAKAMTAENSYTLEQQLADYIRIGEPKAEVLARFAQCVEREFADWQQAQHFAQSQEYLMANIARIQQLFR